MTAPCEWCAKHRETLRKMEDDIIVVERGGKALELLAGEDQCYDTSDAIKFIGTQLAVIGDRLAETFSAWGLHEFVDGEEGS